MMLLVIKGTVEGLRRNPNPKIGSSPDLNLELGLEVRKITLPKNAGLIKAKAKARLRVLVVLRNHSNIGKLM